MLQTSILDRLCGSLCDAVTLRPSPAEQETLEALDRANLFIVPLDDERRWYRYHHLFADLLRQRLHRGAASSAAPSSSAIRGEAKAGFVATLHRRAILWYEESGLPIEAFRHAAAGNDVERAERLYDEYRFEVPIIEWNGQQFVRVSVQGYNTLQDIEALTDALGHLLPQVTTSESATQPERSEQ